MSSAQMSCPRNSRILPLVRLDVALALGRLGRDVFLYDPYYDEFDESVSMYDDLATSQDRCHDDDSLDVMDLMLADCYDDFDVYDPVPPPEPPEEAWPDWADRPVWEE